VIINPSLHIMKTRSAENEKYEDANQYHDRKQGGEPNTAGGDVCSFNSQQLAHCAWPEW
jgi:hypothetical protein